MASVFDDWGIRLNNQLPFRLHGVALTQVKEKKRGNFIEAGTCFFRVHGNKLAGWPFGAVHRTLY